VRGLYQGILQIGVAFHHLRNDNVPGAIKMLRRGLPRLRDLPEVCQGVRVTELARAARAIHDRVAAPEKEGAGPLDFGVLPTITIIPPVA